MEVRDRIMLIDGDINTARLLQSTLKANNYDVVVCKNGRGAIALISSHCPDLIIMDPNLPDMDGLEILKNLREWSAIPLIVLTSRNKERDKVAALDMGADDYIGKPFGIPEFMARVRLALRHRNVAEHENATPPEGVIRNGDLTIDYNKHVVLKNGKDTGLTPTEFRIVAFLSRHIGRIITYEMMLREIWGPNQNSNNRILRVNMTSIRRKIENNPAKPDYIITKAGVGYYFKEQDSR